MRDEDRRRARECGSLYVVMRSALVAQRLPADDQGSHSYVRLQRSRQPDDQKSFHAESGQLLHDGGGERSPGGIDMSNSDLPVQPIDPRARVDFSAESYAQVLSPSTAEYQDHTAGGVSEKRISGVTSWVVFPRSADTSRE